MVNTPSLFQGNFLMGKLKRTESDFASQILGHTLHDVFNIAKFGIGREFSLHSQALMGKYHAPGVMSYHDPGGSDHS